MSNPNSKYFQYRNSLLDYADEPSSFQSPSIESSLPFNSQDQIPQNYHILNVYDNLQFLMKQLNNQPLIKNRSTFKRKQGIYQEQFQNQTNIQKQESLKKQSNEKIEILKKKQIKKDKIYEKKNSKKKQNRIKFLNNQNNIQILNKIKQKNQSFQKSATSPDPHHLPIEINCQTVQDRKNIELEKPNLQSNVSILSYHIQSSQITAGITSQNKLTQNHINHPDLQDKNMEVHKALQKQYNNISQFQNVMDRPQHKVYIPKPQYPPYPNIFNLNFTLNNTPYPHHLQYFRNNSVYSNFTPVNTQSYLAELIQYQKTRLQNINKPKVKYQPKLKIMQKRTQQYQSNHTKKVIFQSRNQNLQKIYAEPNSKNDIINLEKIDVNIDEVEKLKSDVQEQAEK